MGGGMGAFVPVGGQGCAVGAAAHVAALRCAQRGNGLTAAAAAMRSSRIHQKKNQRQTVRMMSGGGDAAPLVDLRGKKALVTGIANNKSIAWGIAQSLKQAGAEIGVTFLPVNEKMESKVRNLTEPLEPSLFIELDVQKPGDLTNMAKAVETQWGGQVDIFVHCLAFANRDDLIGSFSKTSVDGWNLATTVSAHSLLSTTAALKPYMKPGSSVVTLSYLGSVKVIPNYNVMGVAKAALEASTRYLAHEYGPDGIRVNAVSAGPIRTLASSAIGGISGMIKHVEQVAPLRKAVTQKQVGDAAAFLLSEAAAGITGQVIYVDAGYETMGAPPGVE